MMIAIIISKSKLLNIKIFRIAKRNMFYNALLGMKTALRLISSLNKK